MISQLSSSLLNNSHNIKVKLLIFCMNQYLNITFNILYTKIKHKASMGVFLNPKLKKWKMSILKPHSRRFGFFPWQKIPVYLNFYNLNIMMFLSLGDMASTAYSLDGLDTINQESGLINSMSALNLIVFGVI